MRAGCCFHFRGFQHKTCAAGINWIAVTPEPDRLDGSALRAPCWREDPFKKTTSAHQLEEIAKKGSCPHYREPTAAELEENEADIVRMIKRMQSVTPLIVRIKTEHKGKSWSGSEKCPVCGGNLFLTHAAYNGHVSGRCETENCLNWIE